MVLVRLFRYKHKYSFNQRPDIIVSKSSDVIVIVRCELCDGKSFKIIEIDLTQTDYASARARITHV